MFDELMLHGDTLYPRRVGNDREVVAKIRLPWYRCLPFSSIRGIKFSVDGQKVPESDIHVLVADVPKTLDELKEQFARMVWSNLDTQDVVLRFDEPLAGGEHVVSAELLVGVPYRKPTDDPPFLYQYATVTKTMRYEKE